MLRVNRNRVRDMKRNALQRVVCSIATSMADPDEETLNSWSADTLDEIAAPLFRSGILVDKEGATP
jgi:hypothetical protein